MGSAVSPVVEQSAFLSRQQSPSAQIRERDSPHEQPSNPASRPLTQDAVQSASRPATLLDRLHGTGVCGEWQIEALRSSEARLSDLAAGPSLELPATSLL